RRGTAVVEGFALQLGSDRLEAREGGRRVGGGAVLEAGRSRRFVELRHRSFGKAWQGGRRGRIEPGQGGNSTRWQRWRVGGRARDGGGRGGGGLGSPGPALRRFGRQPQPFPQLGEPASLLLGETLGTSFLAEGAQLADGRARVGHLFGRVYPGHPGRTRGR